MMKIHEWIMHWALVKSALSIYRKLDRKYQPSNGIQVCVKEIVKDF